MQITRFISLFPKDEKVASTEDSKCSYRYLEGFLFYGHTVNCRNQQRNDLYHSKSLLAQLVRASSYNSKAPGSNPGQTGL